MRVKALAKKREALTLTYPGIVEQLGVTESLLKEYGSGNQWVIY